MAEKENCPEIFSSIQDNPDGSVSMNEEPIANSIVQALVTNQSVISSCYGRKIKRPIKFVVLIRTTNLIGLSIW